MAAFLIGGVRRVRPSR